MYTSAFSYLGCLLQLLRLSRLKVETLIEVEPEFPLCSPVEWRTMKGSFDWLGFPSSIADTTSLWNQP